MKKFIFLTGFLSAGLLASTSAVAGAVTLYGLLDEGISYVSNSGGASNVYARSGAWSGSRFGLSGTEDLGGQWHAIFALESGFDISSGKLSQNGRMFGRQSWVGLSNQYGKFTIGRQYDAMADMVGPIMSNARGSSPLYDLDNAGADYRTPNALKFVSTRYRGLQAEAMYALGGVAGSFGQGSATSFGLNYNYGRLDAAAAYTSVRNPYATWYDSTGASNIASFGRYLPTARSLDISAVAAAYKFGALVGRAGIAHSVLTQTSSGDVQLNTYFLQTDYWFNPALRLSAAVDLTNQSVSTTAQKFRYRQYNLVFDYLLSVRTDLYAWALYDTAGGPGARAQVGQLAASASQRQLNVQLGIRHRF